MPEDISYEPLIDMKPPPQLDYRRQVRLVVLAGIVQGTYALRNILLMPILTRALGAELFGVWSKINALFVILIAICGLGVVGGMERFMPLARGVEAWSLLKRAALIVFFGGAVLCGLFYAFADGIIDVLDLNSASGISRLQVGSAGFVAATMAWGFIFSHFFKWGDYPRLFWVAITLQVVLTLAAAVVAKCSIGRSLWTPILALGGGNVVSSVFFIAIIRSYCIHRSPPAGGRNIVAVIRYGLPLVPMVLLIWLCHSADRYMLTWLRPDLGNREVGIFSVNYSFGMLVALVISPVMMFWHPAFIRLWEEGGREEAIRYTSVSLKYAVVLAVPIVLVFPVASKSIISLFAGKEFHGLPFVTLMVMGGYIFWHIGMFSEKFLEAELRSWRIFLNTLIASVVNIIGNVLLIPERSFIGGVKGAAISTMVAFAVLMLLHAISVSRFSLRLGWKGVLLAFVSGFISFAPLWVLELKRGGLLLALVTLSLVYALLLVVTGVLSMDEIRMVFSSVGSYFNRKSESRN